MGHSETKGDLGAKAQFFQKLSMHANESVQQADAFFASTIFCYKFAACEQTREIATIIDTRFKCTNKVMKPTCKLLPNKNMKLMQLHAK